MVILRVAKLQKIWSQIARIIKNTEAGNFLAHRNDYWGDGSGDLIFIRLGGYFEGGYDSFVKWAKDERVPRLSAQERLDKYTKELSEKEWDVLELKGDEAKVVRKRIASLKRKIDRASKAIGKSVKNG